MLGESSRNVTINLLAYFERGLTAGGLSRIGLREQRRVERLRLPARARERAPPHLGAVLHGHTVVADEAERRPRVGRAEAAGVRGPAAQHDVPTREPRASRRRVRLCVRAIKVPGAVRGHREAVLVAHPRGRRAVAQLARGERHAELQRATGAERTEHLGALDERAVHKRHLRLARAEQTVTRVVRAAQFGAPLDLGAHTERRQLPARDGHAKVLRPQSSSNADEPPAADRSSPRAAHGALHELTSPHAVRSSPSAAREREPHVAPAVGREGRRVGGRGAERGELHKDVPGRLEQRRLPLLRRGARELRVARAARLEPARARLLAAAIGRRATAALRIEALLQRTERLDAPLRDPVRARIEPRLEPRERGLNRHARWRLVLHRARLRSLSCPADSG